MIKIIIILGFLTLIYILATLMILSIIYLGYWLVPYFSKQKNCLTCKFLTIKNICYGKKYGMEIYNLHQVCEKYIRRKIWQN